MLDLGEEKQIPVSLQNQYATGLKVKLKNQLTTAYMCRDITRQKNIQEGLKVKLFG